MLKTIWVDRRQSIRIGDDVLIKNLGRGYYKNQSRLGIQAPRQVHIVRVEIASEEAVKKIEHLLVKKEDRNE